jgi:PAS domain S-box-containing protein
MADSSPQYSQTPVADAASGLRVLVVDDDDMFLQDVQLRLEDQGYEVAIACSGGEALDVVESFKPQVILLDWVMPGMDGLELCQALRALPQGKLFYIMIFTQYGCEDTLVDAFRAGVDDFVGKPLSMRELVARIRGGQRVIALQAEVDRERRDSHLYLDTVEVVIVGLDRQGDITLVNRKGCDLLGYTERELLGQNWFDHFLEDTEAQSLRQLYSKVAAGVVSELGDYENYIVTRHDGRRLMSWHNSIIRHEGLVEGFLGCGEDITDQRHAEEERARLTHELHKAQKMQALGNLTGGVVHTLNNQLASIMGYTELAKELLPEDIDPSIGIFLQNVYDAGTEAKEFVASLTSFSGESSAEGCVPLQVPLLEDVVRMLSPLLTSSIQVQIDADDVLPGIQVTPDHINQMLTSLCVNARDAMGGSGSITLGLKHITDLSGSCASCHETFAGEYLELSVTDTGPGIVPEVMNSIFNPFFSTKPVGAGKEDGLGLSMVHGTMHGYSGHILVESTPGHGASFRLLFPVLQGATV